MSALSRVEEHLAGCPACREYYEQCDSIAGLLRETSDVAHPGTQYFERLCETVLDRLDDPLDPSLREQVAPIVDLPTRPWQRPLWWAGAMAAAALLALSVLPGQVPRMNEKTTLVASAAPIPAMTELALASGQPDVKVVEENANGRKTLTLALNNPQIASTAMASSPDANQTLDKSVTGKDNNSPAVEEILKSPARIVADLHAPAGKDNLTPLQHQDAEETKVRMAKFSEEVQNDQVIPEDLIARLQIIKSKTISQGNEALMQSLRELEQAVQSQMDDSGTLDALPIVRQASLYLKAEEALKAGHPKEAWTLYRQILRLDEHSLLAARASLQMADLYYSEFADFANAQHYYSRLTGADAAEALSEAEHEQVTRRLERLSRYSADSWNALNLLHMVLHENLPTALSALRQLTETPGTEDLLPEAARNMVENINKVGEDPTALSIDVFTKITFDVYNLIENKSKVTQNKDIQAYLDLALGDLALSQFKDTRQAMICYRKVISEASADSAATKSASLKLNALRDQFLAEQLR